MRMDIGNGIADMWIFIFGNQIPAVHAVGCDDFKAGLDKGVACGTDNPLFVFETALMKRNIFVNQNKIINGKI